MTLDEAIDVMARWLIAAQMGRADTTGWWESFGDIGEYDWDCILLRTKAFAVEPEEAERAEAYKLLAARAER